MADAPAKYTINVYVMSEDKRTFSTTEGAFMLAIADADIEKFDKYFQEELKNDPLIPSEKAMLKTYLWFKLHGEKGADSSTAEPV